MRYAIIEDKQAVCGMGRDIIEHYRPLGLKIRWISKERWLQLK